MKYILTIVSVFFLGVLLGRYTASLMTSIYVPNYELGNSVLILKSTHYFVEETEDYYKFERLAL